MTDSQIWYEVAHEESSHEVECKSSFEICAWFFVAKVESLEYQMYDIAIKITNVEQISQELAQKL